MTWLAVRALLSRVPWQVWAGIAALAALAILWKVAGDAGEARVEAEIAVSDRKAVERAREADSASVVATDNTRSEVEQSNDEARNVANGSDDPLGDGLRSLRRD